MQRTAQGLSTFAQSSPELAANVQPIFITIDPERDTPEVVGEFASAFSDDLIGLTGTAEQIADAASKFRVFYARGEESEAGGYLMDHSRIVYLFGPSGEPLATLPADTSADAVAEELAKWVT
jgi:protein SCO1/2